MNYSTVSRMFAWMKGKQIFLSFFLIVTVLIVSGQNPIPKGYFASPLHIDLSVSGSFGEIRPNHFHSGVDFQVEQKEGLPVYAIDSGWISRLKVSAVGFGNALYIDHPNGFTSVYGHLFGYNDTLAKYIHQRQYAAESFEVDLFPAHKGDTLRVKKGELIGYAGNSGSSFGPHLHFEIRCTATERIINPLLFGFECQDKYSPIIDFIKIYPEGNSFVESSNQSVQFNVKKLDSGDYELLTSDTLEIWGGVGFGVQAFDFLTNPTDRNGWYSVNMYLDKVKFFSMQLDSFAFSETRFINASLDYADSYENRTRVVKSIKLPGNELSLHNSGKSNGIVSLMDNKLHEVVISVGDIFGRRAVVRFIVKSCKPAALVFVPSPNVQDTVMFLSCKNENALKFKNLSIMLPQGSLFDDLMFTYSVLPALKRTYSKRHVINQSEIPLKGKMILSVEAGSLPLRLRSKSLLARIDYDGHMHAAGGSFLNGAVLSEANQFGTYAIVVDTIPPTIKPLRNKSKKKSNLKFKVTDNFSGIDKYSMEINHKWALLKWDPKNNMMIYQFDEMIKPGKNSVRLVIIDKKGNKSTYSTIVKI